MPEPQLDHRGRPRAQYQTVNNLPSKTIQSDAPEADIIKILKKYKQVGIIDHLNLTEATYQDVTNFTDFADVMRVAKEAENQFMELPSKVREIFDHDVANWLDTAHDEEKRASLVTEGKIETESKSTPADPVNSSDGDAGTGDADPPTTED